MADYPDYVLHQGNTSIWSKEISGRSLPVLQQAFSSFPQPTPWLNWQDTKWIGGM